MTDIRFNDDAGPSSGFADDRPVNPGSPASLLVAIAIAAGLVIAIIAATALTATAAEASPAVIAGATRDTVYQVVAPPPAAHKSLAIVLVGGLFLATTAATSVAWRALGRSVLDRDERRPVARRRRRG